uniref:Uncharacterized protein n=1 Tax=Gasterosteus aculeatus aculeatus TaxID=481459 RepID=A0AAQ4PX97_GASAC
AASSLPPISLSTLRCGPGPVYLFQNNTKKSYPSTQYVKFYFLTASFSTDLLIKTVRYLLSLSTMLVCQIRQKN